MNIKTVYDLLSILAVRLNGAECEAKNEYDLFGIYELSKAHSITSAAYVAALPYLDEPQYNELAKKWKHDYKESLYKSIQYEAESNDICSCLSSLGYKHMLLKGAILKNYYPDPAMREFCDCDILCEEAFSEELKDYMFSAGYEINARIENCISYKKLPFYLFEIHKTLIEKKDNKPIWDYYSSISNKLLPDDENEFSLHFTDEDFYIYMTTHTYLHYSSFGTGLRALLDTYVFLKGKGSSLDFDYILQEMQKLGISEYESTLRSLSLKMLSYPQELSLNEDEIEMLRYMAGSATYGVWDNYVRNTLKKEYDDGSSFIQKLRYIVRRILPDKQSIKVSYPLIEKHSYLLPLGYIHRIFVKGLRSFKRLLREFRLVIKK